jgi:arylsulfatase A-like enzyme
MRLVTVLLAGVVAWSQLGCRVADTGQTESTVRRVLPGISDRNVIVILIDTLRADHLPCYGYPRDTAPFICGLAQNSFFFERAISASSYTAPATASIFVGSYPSRHGVITGFLAHNKLAKQHGSITMSRIPEHRYTLGEFFKDQGYVTFSASDNLNICRSMGFDQGFDHFASYRYEGAERINQQVLEWREELESAERFFLYLHYMDPHKPYNRRSPWFRPAERRREANLNAYDSEISFVDHKLAELFEQIQLLQDSTVIVLSDHGEEFLDHGGSGHGRTLYREVIHVPFFIFDPDLEAQVRIEEYASTVSLLPTLAELFGAQPRPDWESPGLVPLMAGAEEAGQPIFSELLRRPEDSRPRARSMVRSGQHFIRFRIEGSPEESEELYDLTTDFAETTDLSESSPQMAVELRKLLAVFSERPLDAAQESFEMEMDAETLEQLRSLGYVD